MSKRKIFNQERDDFYKQYPDFYANYDEDTYQYGLYQTFKVKESLKKELETATNSIWRIFMKLKEYLKQLHPDELHALNISPQLAEYIQCDYLTHHSFISRFDFIVDLKTNDVKIIELNNETPYYLVEAYQMNNAYLLHKEQVRQGEGYLMNLQTAYAQALADSAAFLNRQELRVAILGCDKDEDLEEYNLMTFYQNLFSSIHSAEFIHYEDLRIVKDEGLYNGRGERVDVLFHPSYPIEFLQHDTSEKNEPIGLWMLDLVKQGKLSLINPPACHFLQNKTLLALLWTLHQVNFKLFTEEEHAAIEKYMLPTYTNSFEFEMKEQPYVEKPINGRRGKSVTIYDDGQHAKHLPRDNGLSHEEMVYQKYMKMPTVEVIMDGREHEKKLQISSFVVGGKFNGMVTIVGDAIIDSECHWLPHMIVQ